MMFDWKTTSSDHFTLNGTHPTCENAGNKPAEAINHRRIRGICKTSHNDMEVYTKHESMFCFFFTKAKKHGEEKKRIGVFQRHQRRHFKNEFF